MPNVLRTGPYRIYFYSHEPNEPAHSGTLTRDEGQLTITVVPDSGTGELEGLKGKMSIKIGDGKHSYDFEYTLTQTP